MMESGFCFVQLLLKLIFRDVNKTAFLRIIWNYAPEKLCLTFQVIFCDSSFPIVAFCFPCV